MGQIQLKYGSQTAVPTGLLDGEFAINLDTNQLYYGSGSAVLSDLRLNKITAETYVISSSEMSEGQQEALIGKLKAMTGVKQVKLEVEVDKALIGGFTVRIGSRIVDTSIQGQLRKLASHLGASSPQ